MDLQAVARRTSRQLRRFALTERERCLAEWILDLTLASDRVAVRIPRLEYLERLTGLDRAAVSRGLRALESMRILLVEGTGADKSYQILPDSTFWQVRACVDLEASELALTSLATVNSLQQLALLPLEPSLAASLAAASLEAARRPGLGVVKSTTAKDPVVKSTTPLKDSGAVTSTFCDRKGRQGVVDLTTPCAPPHTPPPEAQSLEVQQFKSSELLNSELMGLEYSEPIGEHARESDLLARCVSAFGPLAMDNWGGLWRKRARHNPRKLERILAALECDQREGKPINNPGGYAHDLWARFHE